MPRGPLPKKNARRRNKPTVTSSVLPASGRSGRAPTVPKSYKLRDEGKEWWKWAWKLPQATQWDDGALYLVARRASLEDDLAALDAEPGFDLERFLGVDESDASRELKFVIGRLKSLAGGRNGVLREMRELDNRLGLNPKALLDLRWQISDEEESKGEPGSGPGSKSGGKRHLRAVG